MLVELKAARARNRITQDELAQKLGISVSAYLAKENGKPNRYFTMKEINTILEELGCKYEDVFLSNDR